MDFVAIKDLRDGMKNINVMFIVLEMTGATKTKEQREVFSFKVADQVSRLFCSVLDSNDTIDFFSRRQPSTAASGMNPESSSSQATSSD